MFKVLIVDDEKIARMHLKVHLKDFNVTEASTFENAIECLEQKFDICFIDLNLNDQTTELFGLEVLKIAVSKGIYSIIMSSVRDEEIIEHAYEIGCKEYFNKGKEEKSIKEVLHKFLLEKDNHLEKYFLENVIPTHSEKQKELILKLIPFIQTEIPICLLGETGTGKTYLASKIHEQSKRTGPFIEVNCGALSEELLDAELFGHHKGAFSGATTEQKGKLLMAHGGTLFLDEIGSMSEKMQAKLLKAIEEKVFYPINSDKKMHSDFRIITATLEDLETKIKAGTFRFDLFQRICGFSITLLPLRDRKDDIIDYFKKELEFNSESNRKIVIGKAAKDLLTNYSWPGNLRQLKRVVELVRAQNRGVLLPSDFDNLLDAESKSSFVTSDMLNLAKSKGLQTLIESIENEVIKKVLAENDFSIRKTMKTLSINQSKVYKYKDL